MSTSPYLSVVIPLYNKQDYILRAVQSVLDQSYTRFELIVVDDGSTDNSRAQLINCCDSRVQYVYQSNSGEGAARNAGVRKAKHDWVAFLDADDSWEENFLSTIVELIQRFPNCRVAASGYQIDNGTRSDPVRQRLEPGPQLVNNYFGLAYQDQLPFCASSVAIEKAALEGCGGFPEVEELGADQGMWCRLLLNNSFAFNPIALATYHQDASGRVCAQSVPSHELPFSSRLQKMLDAGLIHQPQTEDVKRYIAAHLLYLAKLNLETQNWRQAKRFIGDDRTRILSRKRLLRLLQLVAARSQAIRREFLRRYCLAVKV